MRVVTLCLWMAVSADVAEVIEEEDRILSKYKDSPFVQQIDKQSKDLIISMKALLEDASDGSQIIRQIGYEALDQIVTRGAVAVAEVAGEIVASFGTQVFYWPTEVVKWLSYSLSQFLDVPCNIWGIGCTTGSTTTVIVTTTTDTTTKCYHNECQVYSSSDYGGETRGELAAKEEQPMDRNMLLIIIAGVVTFIVCAMAVACYACRRRARM